MDQQRCLSSKRCFSKTSVGAVVFSFTTAPHFFRYQLKHDSILMLTLRRKGRSELDLIGIGGPHTDRNDQAKFGFRVVWES